MKRILGVLAVLGVILSFVAQGQAAVVFYDNNEAGFLADTGAVQRTSIPNGPYPGTYVGSPYTNGGILFTSPAGMYVGNWSSRLDGAIAINGLENLTVNVLTPSPISALGFRFVEPQFDPNVNAPFVDSTFTITVLSNGASLGSFNFNAPNDQASFYGVASDTPFNEVQIVETVGGSENEFFGQFFTTAVPEPASVAVWSLIGLAWAGLHVWRRRGARVELTGGPVRRAAWSEENRAAIHALIERGRHSS